ncbi:cytochrome P450 [Nocardia alba]|uniref:Cytochrome P450 n=1 Tax=Nocardia alba TaxID=225051 RepID=A0A4R1FDI4_9NOCA|nr:cytochrome P450 [Nocardia alba]TCJ89878.1 cytochrome P450 [Nocardia alba]
MSQDTFPFARRCPYDIPDEYRRLQQAGAVEQVDVAHGGKAWILTSFEDVRFALHDTSMSMDRTHPNYPSPLPIPPAFRTNASLLGMDPPEHTNYRGMVKAEFTLRRVRAMTPRIEELVDEHIDRFLDRADRTGDVMEDLALPLTLAVIGELLAIPPEDLPTLHHNTRRMFDRAVTQDERVAAITFLEEYFKDFVASKFVAESDDMISRIIARNPGRTVTEMIHLTRLLLNGGHDSTASMIGLGLVVLLGDRDTFLALPTDPRLLDSAVEELLRLLSVTDLATPRVAAEDVTIGGERIRRGDGVYPSTAAANRDPAVFPDPDRFDPRRQDTDRHVAFGFGRHLCLGADLARVELRLVFGKLAERAPALALTVPEGEIPYMDGGFVYRAAKVPVRW